MNITIKTLSGNKQTYYIDPENSIGFVKDEIEEREGIPVEKIKLMLGAKTLQDTMTLESYGITEASQIIMILKFGHQTPAPNKQDVQGIEQESYAKEVKGDSTEAILIGNQTHSGRVEEKMNENQNATVDFNSKYNEIEMDPDLTLRDLKEMIQARINEGNINPSLTRAPSIRAPPSFFDPIREKLAAFSSYDDPALSKKNDEVGVQYVTTEDLYDATKDKYLYVDDGMQFDTDDDDDGSVVEEKSTFKKYFVAIVAGTFITVVVVVLGFFFFRAEDKEPTSAPTAAPTPFVDDSIPINFPLIDKLVSLNITEREVFNMTDSPHLNALLWLWDQSENKTNIVQQFTLATVLHGLEASRFIGNASGTSECTWDWVDCDENDIITGISLPNLKLAGEILPEIGFLSNLTKLELHSNQIEGTIPAVIGNFTMLKTFDVSKNSMFGTIPEELNDLIHLEIFKIGNNDFEGSIPSKIWGFQNLTDMWITGNPITGTIPSTFHNESSLVNIEATFLEMKGTIPVEIAKLSNLEMLYFGDSDFEGVLHTEYGQLRKMRDFYVGFTMMTGTIPTEFGNFEDLESLVLLGNGLSGTVPSELGNIKNISFFRLEQERGITGTLPKEIASWNLTEGFIICDTRLQGSIPKEWCAFDAKVKEADIPCPCCKKCPL